MKFYIRLIALFFVSIVISSCQRQGAHTKIVKLPNDTVDARYEVYDSLGNLSHIYHKKDSLMHGLNQEFFSNRNLKSDGYWNKGRRNGWFKFYRETGKLQVVRQYVRVDDFSNWKSRKAYLNQVIRFNDDGDTLKDGSFFMSFYNSGKDTIKKGEEYLFKVVLDAPLFDEMYVVLCDLDDKYSLLPDARCDTFRAKNYQMSLSPKDYQLGENIIRGKIVNRQAYLSSSGEERSRLASIYFTNKFYVQP